MFAGQPAWRPPIETPRRFPSRIGGLNLPQIREVIRRLEIAADRKATRKSLAQEFDVPPNIIDWCATNRTRARRGGMDWPFES